MELEKATLNDIEVLFNPTQYSLNKSNVFTEIAIPGLAAPLLQFGRGNAQTLSMELFFDTYEQGIDVREHSNKIVHLLDIDPELHAPPICTFNWGELSFVGVLEHANQTFTLFFPSGVPARATVNISLKQYFDPETQIGQHQSADFEKHYVVRRGDTLSSIAAVEYGDPTSWRLIARGNNIDDPLSIRPGQVLSIPALR